MYSAEHFGEDLATAVRTKKNPVVVGLDPRWEQLPSAFHGRVMDSPATKAEAYQKFCCEIIDVVADLVPAVKPQAAFFEEVGPAGMMALARVIEHAHRKGLLVILDGKRNDIGSTAQAYACGYLGSGTRSVWGADCLTISPYLGADSLEPFFKVCSERGAGLFVLVKTSNPGGGMLQDLLVEGRPMYRVVAEFVEAEAGKHSGQSGYGSVGAVVGATYPEQLAELRTSMPHTWFLVPGFGSQGGTARDVAPAFDSNGLGAVINNSRGIIFAHSRGEYADRFGDAQWQLAVEAATRDMIEQLRSDTSAGSLPGS